MPLRRNNFIHFPLNGTIEYIPKSQPIEKPIYTGHSFDELCLELQAIKPGDYSEQYEQFDDVYMYIADGKDDSGECIIECHIYFVKYASN